MEDRVQTLISEIRQIHGQYINEVGPGGRKVWPKAIKGRAIELSNLLGSAKRAAELAGLPVDTLYVWRSDVNKGKSKALVPNSKDKFVTVTVTNEPKKDQKLDAVTVTVTTPKGFYVEGLPPDLAIEFLLKAGI